MDGRSCGPNVTRATESSPLKFNTYHVFIENMSWRVKITSHSSYAFLTTRRLLSHILECLRKKQTLICPNLTKLTPAVFFSRLEYTTALLIFSGCPVRIASRRAPVYQSPRMIRTSACAEVWPAWKSHSTPQNFSCRHFRQNRRGSVCIQTRWVGKPRHMFSTPLIFHLKLPLHFPAKMLLVDMRRRHGGRLVRDPVCREGEPFQLPVYVLAPRQRWRVRVAANYRASGRHLRAFCCGDPSLGPSNVFPPPALESSSRAPTGVHYSSLLCEKVRGHGQA